MKSYKITMQKGLPFAYITEENPENIAAAIFERFRAWPVEVLAL
jgi:hypothetical protein